MTESTDQRRGLKRVVAAGVVAVSVLMVAFVYHSIATLPHYERGPAFLPEKVAQLPIRQQERTRRQPGEGAPVEHASARLEHGMNKCPGYCFEATLKSVDPGNFRRVRVLTTARTGGETEVVVYRTGGYGDSDTPGMRMTFTCTQSYADPDGTVHYEDCFQGTPKERFHHQASLSMVGDFPGPVISVPTSPYGADFALSSPTSEQSSPEADE
jgi:hypothetical protein